MQISSLKMEIYPYNVDYILIGGDCQVPLFSLFICENMSSYRNTFQILRRLTVSIYLACVNL